ncbi:MAG TPA: HesA/MoeB/ThiF family protein [Candidatus Limnocylindria bacterium]|nr:HesA/MoeB/ThiF family protein [Candidatus Limnocylindria bacterium]
MAPAPTLATDPLARARVLVAGIGGLGAPAAEALADAGVGMLGLVDPDVVELSNLHRQPLYDERDVGRPKVAVAAERLQARAPALHVDCERRAVAEGDAPLLARFDVIVDGTDSIEAKFLLNDLAVAADRPLVHAGVVGGRAQLLTVLPRRTACYRCVFESPPPPEDAVSCTAAGVLGPLPVLAGALQAAEVIRVLRGVLPAFADRLLAIDVWSGTWRSVPLARRLTCAACGAGTAIPVATRSIVP